MSNPRIDAIYPLTPLQQGMLFHCLMEPDAAPYWTQYVCMLRGPLEVAAFKDAWRGMLRRHTVLRTAFVWENRERPLQVVLAEVQLPWEELDWSHLSPAGQAAAMDALLRADLEQGFELTKAPLLRLRVVNLGPDLHQLVWSLHHLLLDGWSLHIVLKELIQVYDSLVDGRGLDLAPAQPFRDYVIWHQQQKIEKSETFWRNMLRGFTAPTPLVMADLPNIPQASNEYGVRQLTMSGESTRRVRDLARRNRLTLNTVMQGAWALLLSRSSSENDVLFGIAVSGRPPELPGVLSMVGMFINTLPFRVRIDPEQPLLEWLQTLQDSQVELRQHDLTPLVRAHAWSDVTQGTPLFKCILAFENYPVDEVLKHREGKLSIGEPRFMERPDLPLAALVFAEEQITLQLTYQTRHFEDATVERILDHWSTLLENMAAGPESRLREIPWMTEDARRHLLAPCDRIGPIHPQDNCVHQLFESQVQRSPDAVAVVCGDHFLTYRQLNSRANQLAHALRALGVKCETPVALHMERSIELIVGLLAILKAGGAYVPIDPGYPADRLAFILEDTRAPVVLTQRALETGLQACGSRVLCMDDPSLGLADQETCDPPPAATGANTIYIIYTSGSTGKPKGCCLTHGNVTRLFQSTEKWFGFDERDVWTMFHSYAFDFSVWEIWGALLYGGKLVVVPHIVSRSPQLFGELLVKERVTVLNQTPSAFKQLMAASLASPALQFPALRYVIFGGEALDVRSLKPWFDAHGDQRPQLVNMYGITETTVHVTYRPLSRDDMQGGSVIGVPIPDLRVYVLDPEMNPCPVGVSGEMYVGGAGVARGYLDRDQLTAERFLASPFVRGDRLYRTGDLARWLPDRDLEYLGRIDHQVKIRGFRIELAEIESVLGTHPEVRAGAVVPQGDGAEGKSLTAFVVVHDAASLQVEDLRAYLGKKLPEYMVPSRFVVVATLPLTSNGKLDRKALETLEGDVLGAGSGYVAPRTELERQLVMVWQKVLNREQVGLQDDFFALGGHSLLAITIASSSSALLGRPVPLRWVFEHPTVEGLARQIDLAPPVSEVLPCITRASRRQPIPMSFGQQRMWLLQQTLPEAATYHIPVAYRISGQVDEERLRHALQLLMRRHEVLRTALVQEPAGLIQRISSAVETRLPWHEMDIRTEPAEQQQALVEKLLTDAAHRPFDLECAPLWRALWLRLGSGENLLALTFHHGIVDEWSLRLIFTEWAHTYTDGADLDPAGTPDLEEAPLQYADFSIWQRQQLAGAWLARDESYWREQLQSLPPPLELPSERTRPPHRDGKGAGLRFELPVSLTDSLRGLARREGVSLFSLLLTAFQVLLHRYSGRDDLIVGVPVANREHPEVQTMLGFFLNTVPLRVRMEAGQSFRTVLRQVQSAVRMALDHSALPFEQIVALATKGREGSQTPLFQVMFVQVEEGLPDLRWGQVAARPIPLRTATSKSDLVLSFNTEGSVWTGELEYATDLFTAETVARMAVHLEELLGSIAADPDGAVGLLNLLPAAELHQLLVGWNNTMVEYPANQCIHALFEAQVERTPDAVAVWSDGQSLTYAELNRLANRLAHHLRGMGVGPEVPVGLCVERSPSLLVGLLGILKAGGAYVPLNHTFPGERLAFYLQDSRARIVVTRPSLAGLFSGADAPRLVSLDELPVASPATNPTPLSRPADLAYVIYTSGSTGIPKGVAIEHRNTVSFLSWVRNSFSDEELAGVLASTSICFDLSVFEILGALSWGGSVVLVEDILAYGTSPHRAKVRLVNTVPSLMEAVLKNCNPPPLPVTVNLAGEALSTALVEAIWAAWPVRRINDLYGPTETTTYSTWCTRLPRQAASIGRPLANTQIYVVDAGMQPVGIGLPGELVIAGAGVARGYLHRPELTSERFVANPFSRDATSRIYRTGDLARWRHDGTLEYLGRMDQQVKIRGFRIEPGEIESVLGEHPDVGACAVVAQDDEVGGKSLAAFLVLREPAGGNAEALRSWLARKLPAYMVPTRFFALSALPLTPNGKLDRKVLDKMAGEPLGSSSCHLAPRNELERQLAEIWEEVLRLDQVGVSDNFFALGGHSLSMIAVVSRLSSLRGFQIPLRWLFEHPTVEALARQIDSEAYKLAKLVPIPIVDRRSPLPMSFGQQQMWLVQQTVEEPATYHVPVAYQLDGKVDAALLRECLVKIMARHEVLRTELVQAGGSLIQRIHPPEEIALPWEQEDLRSVPVATREAELLSRMVEETVRPFNLSKAPLWRVRWVILAEQSHLLVLTFHHGVMDEWSLRLLFRELEQLHAAGGNAETACLPELRVQYADFSVWQREQLAGELLARDRAYWGGQLKSLPPLLEMPTASVRPARLSGRGGIREFELSGSLTDGLRGLVQQEKTSLFKLLLAAFQVWLHRYSGQEDIIVGTPVSGRERPETQSLIGFFLNTLPIRTRLDGAAGFRQLLRQVRDTVDEAMAHASLPFEQIVEIAAPGAAGGRTPLYQTMLVVVEEGLDAFRLGDITARARPIHTATAKCDLLLSLNAEGPTWTCELEYAEDLFTAEAAANMVAHFEMLLRSIVADPDEAIGCLNLLPDDERQRLLVEWNATRREYPKDRCLHQLFEAQVERTPDAVAVSFQQQAVTYREINHRANQLARHLRILGVGPDRPVAVCFERSVEMVVAVLGILKAGGAYVPLDPSYPPERLAYMIHASGNILVVSDSALAGLFTGEKANVCLLDDVPAGTSGENLALLGSPGNLAYILYTSGSTGQPKGVAMEHGPLVNLMHWQVGRSKAGQRVLQFASLNFDVSFQEIFSTWLSGGTLVLIDPQTRLDPAALWEHVVEQNVARVFLPVVMLQHLAEEAQRSGRTAPDLLEVITAGEQLRITPSIRDFFSSHPGRILHNHYGPTESHVVTSWTSAAPPGDWPDLPPIGKPIANTSIYLLDSYLNPVPAGTAGELYIGGAALARGYWNQPQMTAGRFVADPFAGNPEARMYRTGDLARYLPDGSIECMGRMDHQVKIRGFRVELGEVESVLATHPEVKSVVAVVQSDSNGGRNLIAFVVPREDVILSAETLRSWLVRKVPDYMVPAKFAILETLPLTSSGKLDRRALEMMDGIALPAAGTEYVPPATALERQLADIWQEVLHWERVGVLDDFFELGGHSLSVVRMLGRIQDETGVMLSLRVFFAEPKIRPLARLLELETCRSETSDATARPSSPGKPPLFLLGWLLNLESAGLDGHPYYVIPFPKFEHSREECRVEHLAEKCLARLRAIQPHGPYMLVGYSLAGPVAYEMACRLRAAGEDVPLVVIIDTTPPSLLHRLAPAFLGRAGSLLGLDFRLQISLARFWFYLLDKPRHLVRLLGPERRRAWAVVRNDFQRLSRLWQAPKPRSGPPVPANRSRRKIDAFFGARGYGVFWPHMWALCAYRPSSYEGFVGLLVTEATRFERPEPGRGWGHQAPRLREHFLPGDHNTCVTTHKEILEAKLRECVDEASAEPRT